MLRIFLTILHIFIMPDSYLLKKNDYAFIYYSRYCNYDYRSVYCLILLAQLKMIGNLCPFSLFLVVTILMKNVILFYCADRYY